MREEDIPKADGIHGEILMLPNSIVDFKKAGIMFVQKGELSGEEYGVLKAKYLGNGKFLAIDKIPLKKSSEKKSEEANKNA